MRNSMAKRQLTSASLLFYFSSLTFASHLFSSLSWTLAWLYSVPTAANSYIKSIVCAITYFLRHLLQYKRRIAIIGKLFKITQSVPALKSVQVLPKVPFLWWNSSTIRISASVRPNVCHINFRSILYALWLVNGVCIYHECEGLIGFCGHPGFGDDWLDRFYLQPVYIGSVFPRCCVTKKLGRSEERVRRQRASYSRLTIRSFPPLSRQKPREKGENDFICKVIILIAISSCRLFQLTSAARKVGCGKAYHRQKFSAWENSFP